MKGGFTRDYGKTTEDRITTPRTHRDQTSGMNYAECIKIIKNITDDIKAHMEAHPTERIQQKKTKREEYYMRILQKMEYYRREHPRVLKNRSQQRPQNILQTNHVVHDPW
jgi:predicted molibdopterin-dependent oxidoreductase YjgC